MDLSALILSCSARKKARPGPAVEVYDGNLVRIVRNRAPQVDLFFLSSSHGLLPAHYYIEPYDQVIKHRSWHESLLVTQWEAYGLSGFLTVYLNMSDAYADVLLKAISHLVDRQQILRLGGPKMAIGKMQQALVNFSLGHSAQTLPRWWCRAYRVPYLPPYQLESADLAAPKKSLQEDRCMSQNDTRSGVEFDADAALSSLRRRIPVPASGGKRRSEPYVEVLPPDPEDARNPYVEEIVGHLARVCKIGRLNPYVVFGDFAAMIEVSLRHYSYYALHYARTGRRGEDPPEVAEIFRRTNERYTTASITSPSIFREVQQAFIATLNLIDQAAEVGLWRYAEQQDFNPDVIGQVFVSLVKPGREWWPYFPPWRYALAQAQLDIPDRADIEHEALAHAHVRYRKSSPKKFIQLRPGENFLEWFYAIEPFIDPIYVKPEILTSSARLLAIASRFSEYLVARGLIRFIPPKVGPLIDNLFSINLMLYLLNGYHIEVVNTSIQMNELLLQRVDQVLYPQTALGQEGADRCNIVLEPDGLLAETEMTPPTLYIPPKSLLLEGAEVSFESMFREPLVDATLRTDKATMP